MNVILSAMLALAGVAVLFVICKACCVFSSTFEVWLFFDDLAGILLQILFIGGAATFFAALLIGMLERCGA
jgi:hypothetical protein